MEITAMNLNDLFNKMDENEINNLSEIDNTASKYINNRTQEWLLVNKTGESVFIQEISHYLDKIEVSKIKEYKVQYDKKGNAYFRDYKRFEGYIRKNLR
ncbi:MAG: hypothetical protein ACQEQF_00245 [Bacillota bacterium]